MKYIIFIALLIPFFAYSDIHPGIMDSANKMCGSDTECSTVIALELDGSYHDGVVSRSKSQPLQLAMHDKEKSLNDLCDKAPDQNLCDYYKHELIKEFYLGYSKN